jgi:hypothetical protein
MSSRCVCLQLVTLCASLTFIYKFSRFCFSFPQPPTTVLMVLMAAGAILPFSTSTLRSPCSYNLHNSLEESCQWATEGPCLSVSHTCRNYYTSFCTWGCSQDACRWICYYSWTTNKWFLMIWFWSDLIVCFLYFNFPFDSAAAAEYLVWKLGAFASASTGIPTSCWCSSPM